MQCKTALIFKGVDIYLGESDFIFYLNAYFCGKNKLEMSTSSLKAIRIEDYNYGLPDERIAKFPLERRDESKLLCFNKGEISSTIFKKVAENLPTDSLLVSNNTKVIRARIAFHKPTGAAIEVFCLEPFIPSDYNMAFAENQSCQWYCMVGKLKKWKQGELQKEVIVDGVPVNLIVERIRTVETSHIIKFSWNNPNVNFGQILESVGNIPIPPYLNRKSEESDNNRYQTIYSKHKGSVAAPTAGLHFTEAVFESLQDRQIKRHEVTLHVGAGTFKPVQSEQIGDHAMHNEQFIITEQTIAGLLPYLGKITAVGTTSVRTLESLYWLGVKALENQLNTETFELKQWDAYELPKHYGVNESLNKLQEIIKGLNQSYVTANTSIMIVPGYSFKLVNQLLTNFHQPQSTLLLLIGAFIGEDWKKVYNYAFEHNYRFLSYGDSCLLKP